MKNYILEGFNAAVKAGAYKQAVALLTALRQGKTSQHEALVIRLSIGWDWA